MVGMGEVIFKAWSFGVTSHKSESFLVWPVLPLTSVHERSHWCRSQHVPFRLDSNAWVSPCLTLEEVPTWHSSIS